MAANSTCETIFTLSGEKEDRWVVNITRMLQEQQPDHRDHMSVAIFRVPNSVTSLKPESYTPQVLGLGPYHHLDPYLYELESFKLATARVACKQFHLPEFHLLLQELRKLLHKIRQCYRGPLNLSDDTLALLMAIDALFVLETLYIYTKHKDGANIPEQLRVSHFIHSSGKKLPRDTILRESLMLQNQIPLFVLRAILTKDRSLDGPSSSDKLLTCMLLDFCDEISPVRLHRPREWLTDDYNSYIVEHHHHVLDLLLHAITYRPNQEEADKACSVEAAADDYHAPIEPLDTAHHSRVFSKLYEFLEKINMECMKAVKKVMDLALNILAVFGISSLAFFDDKKVLIPSVAQLHSADTKFRPTTGGTRFISFDEKTHTLYLPVITLKQSSEVVMRNLLAYETMVKSESLNFKRYTELMSAMVDTMEDVELLKKFGIVESSLSSAEMLEILDGMTKSMESKDPIIDDAMRKVNKYYHNTQKVRAYRLLKKYIYNSWKILTVFASLLLLLLMGVQTFCQVYDCPSMFGTITKT